MRHLDTVTLLLLALTILPAAAQNWENIELPDGPGVAPEAVIFDAALDGETIWFSTKFDGLLAYDGSEWIIHEVADGGLRSNAFRNVMFVDRDGIKWTAKDGTATIDRLDDGGTFSDKGDDVWRYYTAGSELVSSRVFSMLQDSQGNYWCGIRDEAETQPTTLELLIEGDPSTQSDDEWLVFYADTLGLATDDVRGLALDHDERLWMIHERSGVDVWYFGDYLSDDDDVLIHYGAADGLPTDNVKSLHVAADGRVWAGADGGLAVFDPSAELWTQVEGMPGNRVNDVTSDAQGHIWAATDDGLVMVYAGGEIARIHTSMDGLHDDELVLVEVSRTSGRVWAVSLDASTSATYLNVLDSGFGPEKRIAVYPNPWREREAAELIHVIGVPPGSKVEIYDLSGEVVRLLSGSREPFVWDSLDADLNEVPSGVYIVGAELPDGGRAFTKVAIIR
jgi:streptogramin lyase